jgi:hypothetical protein
MVQEGHMLIFGWGGARVTDHGPTAPGVCPNCHNQVFFHTCTSKTWFRLFFIPVFPYDTRRLLVCPTCTRGFSLSSDQMKRAQELALEHGRWLAGAVDDEQFNGDVATFWDSVRPIEDVLADRALAAGGELPPTPRVTNQFEGAWHPDPSGRHQHRFWDGSWTAYVLDHGETATDTVVSPAGEGWFPDPQLCHELRFWDGRAWTEHVQDAGVPAVDPV